MSTFADYIALTAANWSSLKHYAKSPAHYRENADNPQEQTAAMLLGSAVHCLCLEPDAFHGQYAVAPEVDRRTKSGKEEWAEFEAEHQGKGIITGEQHTLAQGMATSILAGKTGNLLTLCSERELTLTWEDQVTVLQCKARLDAVDLINGLAVDIKTTEDASPKAFARTVYNYLYHGQAAFYLEGLHQNGFTINRFLFLAVEKKPPFGKAMFLCSEELLASGRILFRECLARHAECLEANAWPGYPETIHTLDLPAWA